MYLNYARPFSQLAVRLDGGPAAQGGSFKLGAVTTLVDVVNTTTEANLFSQTILGGYLGSSNAVRFTGRISYLNDTAANDTWRLKIKFGGTTMYEDLSSGIAFATTRRYGRLDILIQNLATNSQTMMANIAFHSAGSTDAGFGALDNTEVFSNRDLFGVSAKDTTLSHDFVATVQHTTAHASISFQLMSGLFELIG